MSYSTLVKGGLNNCIDLNTAHHFSYHNVWFDSLWSLRLKGGLSYRVMDVTWYKQTRIEGCPSSSECIYGHINIDRQDYCLVVALGLWQCLAVVCHIVWIVVMCLLIWCTKLHVNRCSMGYELSRSFVSNRIGVRSAWEWQ